MIESTLGRCEVFCRRTTYERPGARVIEPCAYAECTMNSLRWDLIRWLGYVLRTFTAAPVYHLLFAYSIAVHGCGSYSPVYVVVLWCCARNMNRREWRRSHDRIRVISDRSRLVATLRFTSYGFGDHARRVSMIDVHDDQLAR